MPTGMACSRVSVTFSRLQSDCSARASLQPTGSRHQKEIPMSSFGAEYALAKLGGASSRRRPRVGTAPQSVCWSQPCHPSLGPARVLRVCTCSKAHSEAGQSQASQGEHTCGQPRFTLPGELAPPLCLKPPVLHRSQSQGQGPQRGSRRTLHLPGAQSLTAEVAGTTGRLGPVSHQATLGCSRPLGRASGRTGSTQVTRPGVKPSPSCAGHPQPLGH